MGLFDKKEKINYIPEKKPIKSLLIADDAIKHLKDIESNIFFIDGIDNELANEIEKRANFPVWKTFKTVAFSVKNEKKLFDLINKIIEEFDEQNTDDVRDKNTQRFENEDAALDFFEENIDVVSVVRDEKIEKNDITVTKKERKKLNRTVRKGARFTPEEWARIEKQIEKSGMAEGEFIRKILLEGKVEVVQRDTINDVMIQEIRDMAAEIGRIGGLLKNMIKNIKEHQIFSPVDQAKFNRMIREFDNLKNEWLNAAKKL